MATETVPSFGQDVSAAVLRALRTGIATGADAATLMWRAQSAFGAGLTAAFSALRTATVDAYRAGIAQAMPGRAVGGGRWRWRSQSGCCGYCLSMTGTVHDADQSLSSHPRCRCTPAPVAARLESGAARLERMSDTEVRQQFGPAKAAALQAGAIDLDDLRGVGVAKDGMPYGYERSLVEILGKRAGAYYAR